MKTKFCEQLNMTTLCEALGIDSLYSLNEKQKKARKNIKYCVDDLSQFVNSWYDSKDESARAYVLDPESLFTDVKIDSKRSIYRPGFCASNNTAQEYLKDIRFCGSKFLDTVTLYYIADFVEEMFNEVEGTEEDAIRITEALQRLKDQVGC